MLAAQPTTVADPFSTDPPPNTSVAWKQIAAPVQPFLDRVAERLRAQADEFQPDIASYARYALAAQGKQLRPILVALSGEATGKCGESHVTVAVIIEMIHLATLVHDDVMDDGRIRRGRPTLAANWGNEISILLGDCLFAQALKLAAGFPTPEVCRAVSAATNTVCSGEILQTQRRGNWELSRAEYFQMLAMKTAELFALSCDLGAFQSHAPPASRSTLRDYGVALGTAYQIYDDCLDLFGLERLAGKSLGTDLAKGKLTLPVLIALEKASDSDRRRLHALLQNWKAVSLPEVLAFLKRQGAFEESQAVIGHYLAEARRLAMTLPVTPSRHALVHLCNYLSQQSAALGVSSLP